jgi:hypothetical protein
MNKSKSLCFNCARNTECDGGKNRAVIGCCEYVSTGRPINFEHHECDLLELYRIDLERCRQEIKDLHRQVGRLYDDNREDSLHTMRLVQALTEEREVFLKNHRRKAAWKTLAKKLWRENVK